MSDILVIIDGMTDRSFDQLNNKTPFDYADCRNMLYMKENGAYGELSVCPAGFDPDSLVCNMTLLGMSSDMIPKGRSYFEALAYDIAISEDDLILRCNFVTVKDGILTSSTSETLSEEDCTELAEKICDALEPKMNFHHMVSYKNLLIIKNCKRFINSLHTCPPHQYIGSSCIDIEASSKETVLQDLLRNFKSVSEQVIGNNPRYKTIKCQLWGESFQQLTPGFTEIHHKSAVCIAKTEIIRGICSTMKIDNPVIDKTTADIDTDLEAKTDTVLSYLGQKDLIILHINGTDEASHRRDFLEKSKFISKIDQVVIGRILKEMGETDHLLVCSDHSTYSDTGQHVADPQPFVLYGKHLKHKGNIGPIDGINTIPLLLEQKGE